MAGMILKRLAASVLVLLGVLTIIFVIVRIVPGDPAVLLLGSGATQDEIDALRTQLGLDQPLIRQYAEFMINAVQLNFGSSFRLGGSAFEHVIERLPATLLLAFTALAIVLVFSIVGGVTAARRPGTIVDRMISGTAMLLQSLPPFWIGLILIIVVAGSWRLLPSGGAGSVGALILPSITMALSFMGMLTKIVRNSALEQRREGYTLTARAKGMTENRLFYGHILRNSLIPVVTLAGLVLGVFLGSAVVVETVFAWPGIGRLLIDSILNRDYPIVEAAVFMFALIYIVLNLGVDLIYGVIDPRLRVGANA